MMKFMTIVAAVLLVAGCADDSGSRVDAPEQPDRRPNILLIMADDMGFTDLGAFGGEIDTPHLDALAVRGLRLTGFHAASTCSPTRAMLMSGADNHVAGLGSMAEEMAPNQVGQPGYEGYLNTRVVSLAERLQDAGYRTYMTGKWHLGLEEDNSPAARGFDRSFALLPGGGGHFDDTGLVEVGHPAPFREDGRLVELPDDYGYSSDYFTRRMRDYIKAEADSDRPFFAFLSFSAPHWPLQAPAEYIARYQGRYDDGPEALRDARLDRAKALGVVPDDATGPEFTPPAPYWASLSEEDRKIEARRMEVYAAMVDNLDVNVGRLLDYLDAEGLLDNTVIVFLSDNGTEAHELDENWPELARWADSFDNSYENMGSATSYIWYGNHWGQAGSASGRLYKAFQTQGGLRVPAFISFGGFARQDGISDEFLTVMDLMPTFLDLAGIDHPGPRYKGRDVEPMQGRSMLPWLTGEADRVHPDNHVMGWELFGKRALRRGDWKIVWHPQPFGKGDWELYNLADDPGETRDLSDSQPRMRAELMVLWDDYARKNGVVIPDRVTGY